MSFTTLLEWQTLVFALPMLLALIFLGLSLFGSLGDSDIDADVDTDVDIDFDGDIELDGDVSHSVSHDFSYDVDSDGEVSFLSNMLSILGIGKAPLSIVGFCWLMIFGFVGLFLNSIWEGVFGSIGIMVLVSAIIALTISVTLTSLLAGLIGRIMPQTESYSEKPSDYVNREACVRFTITKTSGTITLYDKYHRLQSLSAHLDSSWSSNIKSDTKVIIMSYKKQDNLYYVIPADKLNKK